MPVRQREDEETRSAENVTRQLEEITSYRKEAQQHKLHFEKGVLGSKCSHFLYNVLFAAHGEDGANGFLFRPIRDACKEVQLVWISSIFANQADGVRGLL